MKDRKKRIIIGIVLFLTLGIFFGSKLQSEVFENDFNRFYSGDLSGRIIYVDKFSRGVRFSVNNSSTLYTFYPISYKQFGKIAIFKFVAKEGDSIVKMPFSDTLFLIKHDSLYKFAFQKG